MSVNVPGRRPAGGWRLHVEHRLVGGVEDDVDLRPRRAPRATNAARIWSVHVITWSAKRMLACSAAATSRTAG